MSAAFRIKFTEINSGSTTAAPVFTVPAGTVATDVLLFAVCFITSTALTAVVTKSGSGTVSEISPAGSMLGTSAQAFIFKATGFVAGDTITVTPSTLSRSVGAGLVYSGADYEQIGAAGATSTTVANAPSITTNVNNDIAVTFTFGIASATGRTFSSYTAGWTSRSFVQGGSTTRFQMIDIREMVQPVAGPTGAVVATASGALLSSTGFQLAVTDTVGGGGGGSGTARKVRVAGVATAITGRNVRVAGVATTATRKTRVGGVAV